MVGTPGTEERLALAEVEDRLRRIRARFNLYTLQHSLYSFSTALTAGIVLLVLGAFLLSPFFFTLLAWPLLVLLAFLLLVFIRRGVAGWTNLNTAARRIDAQIRLKERLSTLVAQLTSGIIGKPSPSVLWPHLLTENTDLLPEWEPKKISPSRIPWSFLPFLAALLLALFVIFLPMLSPESEPNPFSLANIGTVLAELPERAGALLDKKLSLFPDSADRWGGSSVFDNSQRQSSPQQVENAGNQNQGEGRELDARSLASLPEELQKKIRQMLQGLPGEAPNAAENQATSQPPRDRLALKPTSEKKNPDFSIEGQNLPRSATPQQTTARGQGSEGKGKPPSSVSGSGMQAPAQGSGLQQLNSARLDRKNARGTFRPDSPQIPGSGDSAGEGGPGAGSGTDPRLYGNPANLGGGTNTFQIALETTHETGEGEETEEKVEGGIIEKSTKGLNERQSLDDAIRKARVPPEYEEIVKNLFSRGESR